MAAGFDATGSYLLVISHAGRGVFAANSWSLVARDSELAYPEDGCVVGIGPIDGVRIHVKEKDYDSGRLQFTSPNGEFELVYEDGTLTIADAGP